MSTHYLLTVSVLFIWILAPRASSSTTPIPSTVFTTFTTEATSIDIDEDSAKETSSTFLKEDMNVIHTSTEQSSTISNKQETDIITNDNYDKELNEDNVSHSTQNENDGLLEESIMKSNHQSNTNDQNQKEQKQEISTKIPTDDLFDNSVGDNLITQVMTSNKDDTQYTQTTPDNSDDIYNAICGNCSHQKDDLNITGLNYTIQNNFVNVRWDLIEEDNAHCMFNYTVIAEITPTGVPFNRYGSSPETEIDLSQISNVCGKFHLNLEAANKCHISTRDIFVIDTLRNPGKVVKARIDSTFNLSWEAPEENSHCVDKYAIYVDGVLKNNVQETQYNLSDDLDEICHDYNIAIVALSADGTLGPFYNLTTSKRPEGNFDFNISSEAFKDHFNINYLPPSSLNKCKKSYKLTVRLFENSFEEDFNPFNESIRYENAIPCGKYNVTAVMWANDIKSSPKSQIVIIPSSPPREFKLKSGSVTENSSQIKISLPSINYKCPLSSLSVNCSSGKDKNSYNANFDLKTGFLKILDNLTPFTKYKCKGKLYNEEGDFSEMEFAFETKESIPSAVRNLQIVNISETEFIVQWDKPAEMPGKLREYEINITGIPFLSEISGNTNGEEDIKITRIVKMENDENVIFEQFKDLKKNFNYTISVRAKTVDYGPKVLAMINTVRHTSQVTNLTITQISHNFRLDWSPPRYIFGNITNYIINITWRPLYKDYCNFTYHVDTYQRLPTQTYFEYQIANSFYFYEVQVLANTTEKLAECSKQNYTTPKRISAAIKNLTCFLKTEEKFDDNSDLVQVDQYASITIDPPCELNGNLKHFRIILYDEQGTANEYTTTNLTYWIKLEPDMRYTAIVSVVTDFPEASIDKQCEFKSSPGIPQRPELETDKVIVKSGATNIVLSLRNDYFDNSQGEIKYYAILVALKENDLSWPIQHANKWDGTNWPDRFYWNEEGDLYQATPELWKPLRGQANPENDNENGSLSRSGSIKQIEYILGHDNCTNVIGQFCNGPLKPNTRYRFVIRGFTANYYSDSNYLDFVTLEDLSKSNTTTLIIGIVACVLVVLLVLGLGALHWRRVRSKKPIDDREIVLEEDGFLLPSMIKIDEFPTYYKKCMENPFLLKAEYSNLARIGENLDTKVGELSENRKRNRYINILPYDETRVPLQCACNDYINASYIRGYSGKNEYIATQGPLEGTTLDFWYMVVNENCNVVAMVSQFKEQNKIKCHKYFPENREQMEVENDDLGELTIRCAYEMNFEFYVERQIIIQTKEKQHTVSHLQFLNWPDFGCPEGTANMLQFTLILRRHMEENCSKAVIHCSAGVGRTGTLIAVDILLQTIKDEADINIYTTVADLRIQRQKMVQAESQYFYIYKCVNDAIVNPLKLAEIKAVDPIYENLENVMEMKVFKNDNNNCTSPKTVEQNEEQTKTISENINDDSINIKCESDQFKESDQNNTNTNRSNKSSASRVSDACDNRNIGISIESD